MNRRSLLKRAAATAVAVPIAAAAALLPAPEPVEAKRVVEGWETITFVDEVSVPGTAPDLDEYCGECDHQYREHYLTFGGEAGCRDEYPSDVGGDLCQCEGFEPYVEREHFTEAYEDSPLSAALASMWRAGTLRAFESPSVLASLVNRQYEAAVMTSDKPVYISFPPVDDGAEEA